MSAASAIASGRYAAEQLMTDTFTAYAPTGTTKNGAGVTVPAFTSQGDTTGKVQGDPKDTATEFLDVAGVRRPVLKGGLHIPVDAPMPAAGDAGQGWEYVCTAVGALSDMSLLGRRYRVVNVPAKSYATARRLDVVQID